MGGTVWTPTVEVFLQHFESNTLPPLAGVLLFGNYRFAERVDKALHQIKKDSPNVGFVSFDATALAIGLGADVLNFDNHEGAVQATELLIREGHQNIAFLGLHSLEHPTTFTWSVQREAGWKEAMRNANLYSECLSFLPVHQSQEEAEALRLNHAEIGRIAARPMVNSIVHRNVSAVVSVNYDITRSLILCLNEAGIPVTDWPEIIGFDDENYSDSHVIAALSLPWDEIGSKAATFLWDRVIKRQQESPRQESLKMRLIRRYPALPGLYPMSMNENLTLGTDSNHLATGMAR